MLHFVRVIYFSLILFIEYLLITVSMGRVFQRLCNIEQLALINGCISNIEKSVFHLILSPVHSLFSSMDKMIKLRELNLSNNRLSRIGTGLLNCKKIEKLVLDFNPIQNISRQEIRMACYSQYK